MTYEERQQAKEPEWIKLLQGFMMAIYSETYKKQWRNNNEQTKN